MDPILDALLKLGSTGIVAYILWVIAKRFMDETVKQMSSRIDALEIASKACEEDRRGLHNQIVEILSSKSNPA